MVKLQDAVITLKKQVRSMITVGKIRTWYKQIAEVHENKQNKLQKKRKETKQNFQ